MSFLNKIEDLKHQDIVVKFNTQKDFDDFNYYQKIIGSKTIFNLVEYIAEKTKSKEVDYDFVSNLLIYEKNIKRIFFKFIQLLEDYLKSLVIDNMVYKEIEPNRGMYVKITDSEMQKDDFSALYELHKISDKGIDHNRISKILLVLLENEIITKESFDIFDQCYDLRNWILHFNSMYVNDNFKKFEVAFQLFPASLPDKISKSDFINQVNICKKNIMAKNPKMPLNLFLKDFE